MSVRSFFTCFVLIISTYAVAQTAPVGFDGVEKWTGTLTATSIQSLKTLYSTNPPAKFMPKGQKPDPDITPEIDFWQKLVSSGMTNFESKQVEADEQQGLHLVTLAVSMKTSAADGAKTRYVTEQQAWQQQADGWRIVLAGHSNLVKMPPALHPNPNLYEKEANAKAEIAAAVIRANRNHQHVILVFGANWCYDCHVLDQAFHQADVASLLQKGFQIVHVDIGDDGKKNSDVAAAYDVPLNKGIPALAVLDADGKLIFSQKNGEWESARSLDPDDVVAFLNKWKP